ncbi:MAG TPA: 50S ribosomal protein L25 [Thermoguttaceae bacterium]|nr:50S ribosomal protein L25 [Thermoguttaceae bacterium]
MAETLKVEVRESRGKRNARRLRKTGKIPGILYGHGEENVSLSVPSETLKTMVMHGSRLVTLASGVDESAFIRDVQWDTWGTHILHVDFTRISATEKVDVQVGVELRGEAPGIKEGGIIEHLVHKVHIECPAGAIPEKISVSINELKLDDSITIADLELPKGAVPLGDPTVVVVQCVLPGEVAEEEVAEAAPGEPEVIGAKEEEEK